MRKLNVFKTPLEFSDANSEYLEVNEIENNLILGLIDKIEDKSKEYSGFNFLSVTNNATIEAVSFKNSPRAIIAGDPENTDALRLIAEYYISNNIKLSNVIGEKNISGKFAGVINLKQVKKRELIIHQLEKTNDITLSNGRFEKAKMKNLKQISEFRIDFETESFGDTRLKYEEFISDTENRIRNETIYNLIVDDCLVSMAAIVRNTKHSSVIGMVYTPEQYRGKGYGTNAVFSLSNEILYRGFNKSVLFTDKSNPTSNNIYKKIGYEPVVEFEDIYFEKTSDD